MDDEFLTGSDEFLTDGTSTGDDILTDGITKAEFFLAMLERGYPTMLTTGHKRLPEDYVSLSAYITELAFKVCEERKWLEETD